MHCGRDARAKAEEKTGKKTEWPDEFAAEMARLADDAVQLRVGYPYPTLGWRDPVCFVLQNVPREYDMELRYLWRMLHVVLAIA